MESDRDELGEAIQRIASAERQRGHATWFHASNEFQSAMEVAFTAEWAKVINERQGWRIRNIRNNPETYPDCLADYGPEDANPTAKIGIEVTELVDRDAIDAHQKAHRLAKERLREEISDAERLLLLERMLPEWPLEKFKKGLEERIDKKNSRIRVGHLKKQVLLVVTAEPNLNEHTLAQYLGKFALPHPQNFDAVYLMGDYVPGRGSSGHYPVFEVSLLGIE